MKTLTIVIPVYNEERFISETIFRVLAVPLPAWKKEIIVVDDGSTDHTVRSVQAAMKKVRSKNVSVQLLQQKTNQGKGAALQKGFLHSKGDVVIVQDADLEYDPRDFTYMMEPFSEYNADVVFGSRFLSTRPRRVLYFWHYLVNLLLTTFSNLLTGLNISDMETGYKAFKGTLIRSIAKNLEAKRFGFEPEITAKVAHTQQLNIYEVGISYRGRTYAEGKKIGWKDGLLALWEIVYFNLIKR